ncbi:hypothetical protein M406DRAFT_347025 [Cryphonectria parasitica EP155]|uniref:L-tryptophan decarboxylase PsiD-like domain-containing protein n=1 Tax=Cryphonectria parasitica (strain ATCC 38755 / EP155) TaxID=660469 RepID=A0A9P4XXN1_CRYP1|nr:uncharacterized protein M406DRAFT_347025 [Cryphonectria parasitica EP155]KAF3763179.1 hypothetical protein M406DRAFT_347025 [Cryphonectria parasitica EP155]
MVQQHGDHHDIPAEHKVHKPGAWLPTDTRIHKAWLKKQVDHVDNNPKTLIPVLQEFKDFIETNPRIRMLFTQMWEEVPNKEPYNKDPTGHKQIRDYGHMLAVLNHIFSRAPEWTDAAEHVGMVGVPMCAVFDYPMATPSGHAAFLDPDVNRMLKKVLNEWGRFLQTPESAEVLNDSHTGWFGKTGVQDVMAVANAPLQTSHKFEEHYKCDATKPKYGFKSWDDFFTRELQESARPVADPEDDNVIVSACESRPYAVQRDVKFRDTFWIKGQPYSIVDMLNADPLAEQFRGGTAYQAFLSALSYHRWHAPVSGTVKKAFLVDGTYFSEPLYDAGDLNSASEQEEIKQGISAAQGYLSCLAARAVIFIEADNPAIGLMAFIGIGMDEVSTCEITVKEGQHIKKGDQTGMFHFGGSTHVLLFRKGVQVDGFPEPGQTNNVAVRSKVAVVQG